LELGVFVHTYHYHQYGREAPTPHFLGLKTG